MSRVTKSNLFFPVPRHVYGTCAFVFIARRLSAFSSLVDSHRIAPTHAARRSQQ